MVKPLQPKNATQALILAEIRRHAPTTRSEIARRTGYTPATVTHTVASLLEAGFVEELGRRQQSRGQPPIELRIRPHAAYTLGVQLEHREISCVLADADGTVLARHSESIKPLAPDETMRRLQAICEQLRKRARIDQTRLLGAGLAAFGPMDLESGTISPPIYSDEWQDVPARDMLAKMLDLPVYLDNNATAAAIGEYWYGVAQRFRDFLYIFLGFGVGGGLFLAGRVHRGTSFNAGEVGHVIVSLGGPPWYRGSPGSLEAVVSLLAMERDLGSNVLNELPARFESQEPLLIEWLENAARYLGQVVVSADHLLDLEAVVFGGLLPTDIVAHLIARVRHHCDGLGLASRPHRAELLSGNTGPHCAALGAAMLPIYDAFLPAPTTGNPVSGLFSSPP
jgi:predicted NBD/HSP70 family sugar kinase